MDLDESLELYLKFVHEKSEQEMIQSLPVGHGFELHCLDPTSAVVRCYDSVILQQVLETPSEEYNALRYLDAKDAEDIEVGDMEIQALLEVILQKLNDAEQEEDLQAEQQPLEAEDQQPFEAEDEQPLGAEYQRVYALYKRLQNRHKRLKAECEQIRSERLEIEAECQQLEAEFRRIQAKTLQHQAEKLQLQADSLFYF